MGLRQAAGDGVRKRGGEGEIKRDRGKECERERKWKSRGACQKCLARPFYF